MVSAPSIGGGTVWPSYGSGSILGLSRAVRGFFEGSDSVPPLGGVEFGGVEKILLMVVDGLGLRQLEYGIDEGAAPNLERVSEDGGMRSLVTALPSTTAAALTTLGTGAAPEEHGMLGYRLYLEEVEDIVDMLMFTTVGSGMSLTSLGHHPGNIVTTPPLLEVIGNSGHGAFGLTREEFLPGPLTEVLYRGGTVIGYSDCADLMKKTARVCRQKGKALIIAYWDSVDVASHRSGSRSGEFLNTLSEFDQAFRRELLSSDMGNVLLLLTADHGLIDCPSEQSVELREHLDLVSAFARPPTGEPRLPYLHVKQGQKRRAMDYLDDHFSDVAQWMTSREAFDAHLFGPDGNPRWEHRIGDLVLLPAGGYCFIHPYLGGLPFVGRHGGISPQEMLVPLLWSRL